MQAGVGEERGCLPGDRLADRFDHQAGQGLLQSRAVDAGMHHLDEGDRRGDHTQVIGACQGEPAGHRAVTQNGFG
ncbi:hypothetical protein GCM10019016_063690 [Streptomyces prasinosporus]|uniref:Uncharacterized protein n=1 Tax=Streptomyces prasinosporus TaxID=68256 RepID=A0ABP6TWY9_9ACTN